MLLNFLNTTILDIEKLVEITQQDIDDIKLAKHENVFNRVKEKNLLIKSFEKNKNSLDKELLELTKIHNGTDIANILTDEDREGLKNMKEALERLHAKNKEYARFVVSVGEFYNSLIESMFPSESEGYQKSAPKPASFLKVRV